MRGRLSEVVVKCPTCHRPEACESSENCQHRRDDVAAYESFLAADQAASVAHDFIYGKNDVTQQQASDALWTVHNALRPYIVLDGDD